MLFRRKRNEALEKYKRIREMGRELTEQIMDHMSRFVLTRAASDLNLWGRRNTLVFDSEEDTHFLMDRCFYDIYWEGKNLIGHYMESDAYEQLGEEERTVVQGMTNAYYSLFEILNAASREARLELDDLLGERTYTLMDVNLSVSA